MFMRGVILTPLKIVFMLVACIIVINMVMFMNFSVNLAMMMEWSFFSCGSFSLSFVVLLDKVSLLFSTTVMLISVSVMLYTVSYMVGDDNLDFFTYVVVLFILSMNFLIFCPSLVSLILGWDGLGLTSYLLVIYYMNSKSLSAGMLTALTNRIGDALLILGISWGLIGGHWNLSVSVYNFNVLVMVVVLVAAMTKSAQIPFSAWLPAAMAAPTPVSALVHSSTLVTAGVYMLIRYFSLLDSFSFLLNCCFYLGALTCMLASTSAIVENDLKKIIALSTLSQLGIMMMALGMGQPNLAFFHLITHALFKALLFICAGSMISLEGGNQDIRLMGKIYSISPVNAVVFNIANLSLCGVPFMGGYYSKDLILENFFSNSSLSVYSGLLVCISICLTTIYSVRLSLIILWSNPKSVTYSNYSSMFILISYLTLICGAVMGGVLMNWLIEPCTFSVFIPFLMKVYLIMMMVIIFYFSFALSMKNNSGVLMIFFNSMWFLSFISSNPLNSVFMNISSVYFNNEMVWMEKLSGKGSSMMVEVVSKYLQKNEKLSTSGMVSIMMVCGLLVLLFI